MPIKKYNTDEEKGRAMSAYAKKYYQDHREQMQLRARKFYQDKHPEPAVAAEGKRPHGRPRKPVPAIVPAEEVAQ